MTPHYSKWFGQNYVIRAHVILNASLRIHFSARIIAIHITVWHALKWKKITLKQSGLFLFSEKTIIHVDELDVFWHNLRHNGIYIYIFFLNQCFTCNVFCWESVERPDVGWTGLGFEPRWRQEIFLLQKVPIGSGAQLAFYSMGTGFLSRGVKWPESEVNQSPPSTAVVKNEWRYTSFPPLGLHGTLYGELFYRVFLVTH